MMLNKKQIQHNSEQRVNTEHQIERVTLQKSNMSQTEQIPSLKIFSTERWIESRTDCAD